MKQARNLTNNSDDSLLRRWHNCLRRLVSTECNQATALRESIEVEWARRRSDAIREQDGCSALAPAPERGLLQTLGYHVGETIPTDPLLRRLILDRVVLGEIPFVHSGAYTSAWGEPGSPERRAKLARTLSGLIDTAPVSRPRAVRDWTADLEYVKSTYGDR